MYANEVQIESGSGFIKTSRECARQAHERDFLIGWLSAQTRDALLGDAFFHLSLSYHRKKRSFYDAIMLMNAHGTGLRLNM
jgi:hypothetical protein